MSGGLTIAGRPVQARQITADDLVVVGRISGAFDRLAAPVAEGQQITPASLVEAWPEIKWAAEQLMSTPDHPVDLGPLPLDEAIDAIVAFAIQWLQVNGDYTAQKVAPSVETAAQATIQLVKGVQGALAQ